MVLVQGQAHGGFSLVCFRRRLSVGDLLSLAALSSYSSRSTLFFMSIVNNYTTIKMHLITRLTLDALP